jgi:hypothetical protein
LAPSITPKKGIGMDTQENEEISQAEYDRQVAWVEDLAREIRRVDGAHKLGASELAQSLMPFLQRERTGEAVAEHLDVRKIMLRVVPGDGSGHEVFASCVADVESLLSEMGEQIESYELASPPSSRELVERVATLEALAAEYNALICHMDAGGDFFAFMSGKRALIPQEPSKEEGKV